MRQHSPQLVEVLSGSFNRRLFVNVFHGPERVAEDQAFSSWSLSGDLEAAVHQSGSGTVVHQSVSGESVAPVGTSGVLSPYRARLELVMEISAGDFVERVSLGKYRLTKVPKSRDRVASVGGVDVVVASEVSTVFMSAEDDVRRRGVRRPESPPVGATCWDEIRRLTGMPIEQTVEDVQAPPTLKYEAKRGGRLEAVQALAEVLGGVPLVNSAGAWEIIPNVPGEPVAELWLGERGTVLDVGTEIDTEDVVNAVIGVFEDELRNPIYSIATVNSGDLSVDGLYGENTDYYTNDQVRTQYDADVATQARLDLLSGAREYDVPIQCHLNPLIELGDVVSLNGWVRPLVGRVVSFGMSDSPYMNVTLRVRRSV